MLLEKSCYDRIVSSNQQERVLFEIKTSRTGEETPEAMVQFLASLTNLKKFFLPGIRLGIPISLELAVLDQTIHFYLSIPSDYQAFIEGQILAHYPKAFIAKATDYLPAMVTNKKTLALGQMKLLHGPLYPLKTYTDFKEVDSLTSLLGLLSKVQKDDKIAIQLLLVPVSRSWQRSGEHTATTKVTDAQGSEHANPYGKVIMQKIADDGFKTAIRMAVATASYERSKHFLRQIAHSFATYNRPVVK